MIFSRSGEKSVPASYVESSPAFQLQLWKLPGQFVVFHRCSMKNFLRCLVDF